MTRFVACTNPQCKSMNNPHQHAIQTPEPRTVFVSTAQRRVLAELTRDGPDNETISRRLGLTIHTVKAHVQSLCRAFDCHNRTQLAVEYLRGRARVENAERGEIVTGHNSRARARKPASR